MRFRIILLCFFIWGLATAASAQTKISGTVQCGKPDEEHSIPVGDRPDHSFVISRDRCTWTRPIEIAGIQSKELVGADLTEISGDISRSRFYCVDTMANGDKAYYRGEAIMTLKGGVPQSGDEKWTLMRATGKLKGIKAKGTFKLKAVGTDGSSTWNCEGEYELPKQE